MTAMIIDGKKVAAEVRSSVGEDAARFLERCGRKPGLNLLLVGNDGASEIYVAAKSRDCEQVGIASIVTRLPESATESQVVDIVNAWNGDSAVDGILVQLPLPRHIDEQNVLLSIAPDKDVDGFHPENAGRLMIGMDGFVPCTPAGIIELLTYYDIPTKGKHVVVVGRSNIVGKPIAMLLAQKTPTGNATVTLCHSGTVDLPHYTRQADILIAAVGVPGIIGPDHVKAGAVVVDVGINRMNIAEGKSRLVGDVATEMVMDKVSWITPVPGGIGPMTRAMLLVNTMKAAWRHC